MNNMKEVAKMLGVEIGQEFKCNNGYKYVFTENGIIESTYVSSHMVSEENFAVILCSLLNGKMTIISDPWKPNNGDVFWYINRAGVIDSKPYGGSAGHMNYYKLGNCYRSKQEAEVNRDKWIEFYASDEVLTL